MIDSNTVNHLAAILGHDVEQVIYDSSVGAVGPNLEIHGRILIHRHRLNVLAMFAKPEEEGSYRLTRTPRSHPEYAPSFCIHDHRGIAMTLV